MSLELLYRSAAKDRHRGDCDGRQRSEPHPGLGRMVEAMIEVAANTPRLATCDPDRRLCPRARGCAHCDMVRAERALYRARGADYAMPACCLRPQPRLKRRTMWALNALAAQHGLPAPFVLRREGSPCEIRADE